ncbi:MAG: prepilin peptidase [Candidatus Saccharimonadales bacterium]
MVIALLVILGLALGSFVNAFVWRLHEGKSWVNARSMCPKCHHELSAIDLVPLLSWLWLGGKCRYCQSKISLQYPIIEALGTLLFLLSYALWPDSIRGAEVIVFSLWLLITTGLVALALYDLRYMLLPTKLIYSLLGFAIIMSVLIVARSNTPLKTFLGLLVGSLIGGGIFYLIYILSSGKWIGGGDVRIGFLLGLLAATPARSLLLIFVASLIGTIVSLSLMSLSRLKRSSLIPFGPFLICALFIVQFYGQDIIHWYNGLFL